jgi:alpha-glucosidase (family GH31 glycosyl hydrolase)
LDTPIQKINVHVRGGFIIPMQIPGPNIILGRGNPFQLLVALSSSGSASGNLFWDDGDSIGMFASISMLSLIEDLILLFDNYRFD